MKNFIIVISIFCPLTIHALNVEDLYGEWLLFENGSKPQIEPAINRIIFDKKFQVSVYSKISDKQIETTGKYIFQEGNNIQISFGTNKLYRKKISFINVDIKKAKTEKESDILTYYYLDRIWKYKKIKDHNNSNPRD